MKPPPAGSGQVAVGTACLASVAAAVLGAAGSLQDGQGTGHGLIGMRERAALYGGSLAAGPGPDGGFAVRMVLPVDGGPVADSGSAESELAESELAESELAESELAESELAESRLAADGEAW